MPHFKITRALDDYGGETIHTLVGGRTLTLKRGESATIPLDEETEAHFLRDLRGRSSYLVENAVDSALEVAAEAESESEIDRESAALQHADAWPEKAAAPIDPPSLIRGHASAPASVDDAEPIDHEEGA